ncbi:MAG TPA: transcription termination factor NusA [Dehalococcoidia bacterium]|nr:transcription termination factor NusA [Dehalococcoidia bacterium]
MATAVRAPSTAPKNDFLGAIALLAAEKNLPKEVVFEAVEAALASAYKKDALANANLVCRIDGGTGGVRVYAQKEVVEEVEDDKVQITLDEAKQVQPNTYIGDFVNIEVFPQNAGRIAAQTAKQVVLQRLREAEREVVFEEYSGKEGDIISAVVHRLEARHVFVDLGKTEAVLPPPEQVRTEHYRPGQRLKVYLLEVHKANRGPQVTVSRTHKNLLRRLFELEVPEIFRGSVEIKAIAREPGFRSKVAVYSRQEGIDPVGACVGLRGIRIQNIVNELNGERIDVVQWDPDPARFVANALSPAQVHSVRILPDGTTAEVVVVDRQLSLAIGKEGQNARLGAKLTGLRIDIKSLSAVEEESEAEPTLQMSAEPEVRRETPIWEELAADEAREQEREAAPSIAATIETPVAPAEAAAQRPAGTVLDRPGAVRFGDEIIPRAQPGTPDPRAAGAPAAAGGRRGGRRGPQRETEEQARARRAAASRKGGSRRAMEEEIEEELEALMGDEDFDFFKDEDEN